jgi:leucyl aminopeptidase
MRYSRQTLIFQHYFEGITYDTGGADVKAGGIMAGMHRDKCGAAAVAGFFKVSLSIHFLICFYLALTLTSSVVC